MTIFLAGAQKFSALFLVSWLAHGHSPIMLMPASWRSHPNFILAIGSFDLFTDFFSYGIVLPVLSGLLVGRLALPDSQVA